MKKTFLAVSFFVFFINVVHSQPAPPVAWVKAHNGNNLYDEATAMKVDAAGNSYVTGRCYVNGTEDYCTIKYNPAGAPEWTAYYSGSLGISDRPTSIDVDAQGNVYVTGFGNFNSNDLFNSGDFCTVKYNSSGAQQWVQIYTAPANKRDYAYKVVVDAGGNVYVTGSCWFDSQRQDDIVTIKYNSAGQVQWTSTLNGNHANNPSDRGSDMIVDAQGNVFVFGMSTLNSTYTDFCLVKYNAQGTQQFVSFYHGTVSNGIDNGAALSLDNAGNIYVTGTSDGAGTNTDIVTIKYSTAGAEVWSRRYNNAGLDNAADITNDAAGNVYVSGNKSGKGLILKYDTNGSLLWEKEVTGTGGNEIISSLLVDASGDIYGTGKVSAGTFFDFVTLKINPLGSVQWRATYNGSGNQNDFGNALGIDGSGNIYVTGSSVESGQNGNFCTIKYAPGTIGIEPVSSEIPSKFELLQNYPNPFNPTTNIGFRIADKGFVSVKVYDMAGKEIAVLINENLSPGVYNIDLDASGFTSGIFFYKLQTEGYTETKKMILVK